MIDTFVVFVTVTDVTLVDGRVLAFLVGVARSYMAIFINKSVAVVVFFVAAVLHQLGRYLATTRQFSGDVVAGVDACPTDAHINRPIRASVASLSCSGDIRVYASVAGFIARVECAQIRSGAASGLFGKHACSVNTHLVSVTEAVV